MFFSRLTSQSTATFSKQIAKPEPHFDASDAVIIGAGAVFPPRLATPTRESASRNSLATSAARYGFTRHVLRRFLPL